MHPFAREYLAGKSLREIANTHSTNATNVMRVLQREGIPRRDCPVATRAYYQQRPKLATPAQTSVPAQLNDVRDQLAALTLAVEHLTDIITNRPSA